MHVYKIWVQMLVATGLQRKTPSGSVSCDLGPFRHTRLTVYGCVLSAPRDSWRYQGFSRKWGKKLSFPPFFQQSKLELKATMNEMKLESTVESSCILITNLKEELQVVVVILMLSSISLFAIARHFKQTSLKFYVWGMELFCKYWHFTFR